MLGLDVRKTMRVAQELYEGVETVRVPTNSV